MTKKQANNEIVAKEEQTIKPMNPVFHWFAAVLGRFLARVVFRTKRKMSDEVKNLKEPCLVLAPHASAMDVGLVLAALYPKKLSPVCGRDVFSWSIVKKLGGILGLLPISQFETDIHSLRLMKRAVAAGQSIELFPEGKVSLDGRPLHYISPSIVKLMRFLGVPVVMVKSNGAHVSRPKWFKMWKRGRIEQEITLLITKEELSLPNDVLYQRVLEAFDYNDHRFQVENNIRYKSKKPAKGLHYILFKCPKCEEEYAMRSTDRTVVCDHCGNEVELSEWGNLVPEKGSVSFSRVDEWYLYERLSVRDEVNQGGFFESHPVVWFKNDNNEYVESGEGELFINDTYLGFVGRDHNGNAVEIKKPLAKLVTIVQKTKEAVDITDDKVIHRFYFREGKYSVRYTLLVEESFAKLNHLREVPAELPPLLHG